MSSESTSRTETEVSLDNEHKELNEIEQRIQTTINEFNEWNTSIEKDMNQVDVYVNKMKELIAEIKNIQNESGTCPTSSEFLTNLLTISLVLNSYKSNTNFDE